MPKKLGSLLLALIIICVVYTGINAGALCRKYIFPIKYEEYIDRYSAQNGIDKYFICAVIKTESNFDPNAVSGAGAEGLMQIMEDAFDWVKYRMNDKREIGYKDMFDPEYNIEYGTYLLAELYSEFGDKETALAAYFAGRGQVSRWLSDKEYSDDGKTLRKIPSAKTEHYVNKVMTAYRGYTNLYSK